MKIKRKIIEIDEERCDGCGLCVPSCAEGTLAIVDGKAKVVSDNLCDGLGACLGECPNNALHIIERVADEFDEHAVEKRLADLKQKAPESETLPCGCPSTQIMDFGTKHSGSRAILGDTGKLSESELSHWPIKIRLVPSNAPFLNGADLLILADCAATAYPDLHEKLIKGRAVMMGCPKFDDVEGQGYVDKIEKICRNSGIKSLTTVTMEVPCCSGLNTIVRKGLAASGKKIPLDEVLIGRKGELLSRCTVFAGK